MPLSVPLDAAARPDVVVVRSGVWIRNRRRTVAWAVISGLYAVVFAGLPFVSGGFQNPGAIALAGVCLAIAVAAAGLAVRVARAGVSIDGAGIVVRGPFRTRSVALADAGGFVPGLQGRGGNGTPCPMLERRTGGAVGVWALGRRNIWFRYDNACREIRPLCHELTALAAALRLQSAPAVASPPG